ncbi:MAG TPA: mechanosensitive ion channel [Methanoculleus sp.]|nr:mechanosensitive ion channel [Methanoculleus sp.]
MLRELVTFLLLIALAAVIWFASTLYDSPYLPGLFLTTLAIALVYLVFRLVADGVASRAIKDAKTRYTFRKAVSILFFLALAAVVIRIWVDDPQVLLLSYGLLAAGLAIALQDVFKNFVGGILIIATGLYGVGDRIEAEGVIGDVMDIGMMGTTLLEIQGWVAGDQPTGRITVIPNGFALSGTVHNYTKDNTFIWDEIAVPVTYDSDWKEAAALFLGVVRGEVAAMAERADRQIAVNGEKYYLPKKMTEPAVFLTLTDNWITFDIRYVAAVRERRVIHDRLTRLILAAVEQSDRVRIASETIIVTGTHDVRSVDPHAS